VRNRFPFITTFIVIAAIVFTVGGWRLFAASEAARFRDVDAVRHARSYVELTMSVNYPSGPIASEAYRLVDDDGRSMATYAVSDRRGSTATFHDVIRGYDVSFAFQKMVQDGIWQLDSKRARASGDTIYVVGIHQIAQDQSGKRVVTFSDPQYWAHAAGHQFHIILDPHKATPTEADLLNLQSTSNADPRYLAFVNDFTTFGSPQFKKTIAAARSKLLRS